MGKYLDGGGLSHFWLVIKTWVNGQGFITSADIPEGAAASTVTPIVDGTASKGTDNGFARGDHVHPTDTSRVAANTAITGATKTKITYDSKGLVTAGDDLSESDIPSLHLTKITDVTATYSELNVLHESSVTATEMGYLHGVTSAIQTQLGNKAPLASPALTGTPTAPTVSTATDNSTSIATTAFVQAAISAASAGAAVFKGVANAGTEISSLTAYSSGWYWVVGTAGTYAGQTCEAGDFIFCVSNYSSAYSASDFSVVQQNIDTLSDSDIDTIIAQANTQQTKVKWKKKSW